MKRSNLLRSLSRVLLLVPALSISLLSLSACGGGGAKNVNISRSTTLGQELKDLKHAFDSGALSEREYEEQRAKLLSETRGSY